MSDDVTNWTALREFLHVDLTNSYLLSWDMEGESLLADVDLCLCPEHPFYEKPRPAEKACFRPAFIEFPRCISAHGAGADPNATLPQSLASLAGGRIHAFRRRGEGQYEIEGDFGAVRVAAERPMVRLKHHVA